MVWGFNGLVVVLRIGILRVWVQEARLRTRRGRLRSALREREKGVFWGTMEMI